MLTPVLLVLIAAIAYMLGSVNGSIIISRYLFRSDVRTMGSGNAGLTNFYRNYGAKGIVGVLAIDIVKGVLAALIGLSLIHIFVAGLDDVHRDHDDENKEEHESEHRVERRRHLLARIGVDLHRHCLLYTSRCV